MAGLKYVGRDPSSSSDIPNKADVDGEFANATVSQTAVAGQVTTAIAGLASQTSVNNALAGYIQPNYYKQQEATLLPLAGVGLPTTAANPGANPPTAAITGVASLDGGSPPKIPLGQVPVLGSGYMSGPYGPTTVFSAAATNLSVKIADWNLGATGLPFQPLVWMSMLIKAINLGRPVVEVWISNAPFTYGSGTLVARGMGRNYWNDLMTVTVRPVPNKTGQVGGVGYPSTYTAWLTAWMYDLNGAGVNVINTNIVSGGVFLWRYTS